MSGRLCKPPCLFALASLGGVQMMLIFPLKCRQCSTFCRFAWSTSPTRLKVWTDRCESAETATGGVSAFLESLSVTLSESSPEPFQFFVSLTRQLLLFVAELVGCMVCVCMCICVGMHICVFLCMCVVCVGVHTFIYIHMGMCICLHTHAQWCVAHVNMCTHTYVWNCVYTHVYIACKCVYACMQCVNILCGVYIFVLMGGILCVPVYDTHVPV